MGAAAQGRWAGLWTGSVRGDGVAIGNADTVSGDPLPPTEFSVQFVFDPPAKGVERELNGKVVARPRRAVFYPQVLPP